jgi:hypothetical protein
MSDKKLYLITLSVPAAETNVRLLVPAESQAKAKARVIDAHLTVRLVGGVEALALAKDGVVVLEE